MSTTASDRAHAATVTVRQFLVKRGMHESVAERLVAANRHRIYVSATGGSDVRVMGRDGSMMSTGGQDPIEFLAGQLYVGAPLALQKGLTEAEAEEMTADGSIYSELKARERVPTVAEMREKMASDPSMYQMPARPGSELSAEERTIAEKIGSGQYGI